MHFLLLLLILNSVIFLIFIYTVHVFTLTLKSTLSGNIIVFCIFHISFSSEHFHALRFRLNVKNGK